MAKNYVWFALECVLRLLVDSPPKIEMADGLMPAPEWARPFWLGSSAVIKTPMASIVSAF